MYACDCDSADIVQMFLKHPKVDADANRDVGSSISHTRSFKYPGHLETCRLAAVLQ